MTHRNFAVLVDTGFATFSLVGAGWLFTQAYGFLVGPPSGDAFATAAFEALIATAIIAWAVSIAHRAYRYAVGIENEANWYDVEPEAERQA